MKEAPSFYVEVLVDKAPARLGSLSYRSPSQIPVGTAVEVPFGKRIANGVVIGEGDPAKATRDVIRIWGSRIDPADIAATRTVAAMHFAKLADFALRFAPSDHKGDDPLCAGPVLTVPGLPEIPVASQKLLLRSPDLDPAAVGAAAAERLVIETEAQILVVCPSKKMATKTLSFFESGAAALDTEGAWAGFRDGSVTIGVTTRTGALWSPDSLGGIVVLEEDHPGHIELRSPHTNARDVAIQRAAARQVPIVLTSASPTGAALGAGVKVEPVGVPIQVQIANGDRKVPAKAIALTIQALRAGKTVAVFARSATVLRRCGKCHEIRSCQVPECRDGRCAHEVPLTCPRCNDRRTYLAGVDVSEVERLFPEGVVALDPTKQHSGKYDVVVAMGIDNALHRPGFSPEHAVMRSAMSAAGNLNSGGTLIVTTAENPDHPVLQALAQGQVPLARLVWKRCAEDALAPFGLVVKLEVSAAHAPNISGWPGKVLGPLKVGHNQWEILVRLSEADIPAFQPRLDRLRSQLKVRYQLL